MTVLERLVKALDQLEAIAANANAELNMGDEITVKNIVSALQNLEATLCHEQYRAEQYRAEQAS